MICKKCGKSFLCKMWRDGKEIWLHRRSYCLECSPYKGGKGYELRKEINPKKDANGCKTCIICSRVYKRNKNDVCSTCRNWYHRKEKKKRCVEYKGGECTQCRETDIDILAFHHRNPEEKNFGIAYNLNEIKWEKLKEELDKCDILCMNCHTKLHKKEEYERFAKIESYYNEKALMAKLVYAEHLKCSVP